ncbi:hypothetical protein BDQ94DRAFT_134276, partial [Aspergillus welwitschiae]
MVLCHIWSRADSVVPRAPDDPNKHFSHIFLTQGVSVDPLLYLDLRYDTFLLLLIIVFFLLRIDGVFSHSVYPSEHHLVQQHM